MSPGDTAVNMKKCSLEGRHSAKLLCERQLMHSIERYVTFLQWLSEIETQVSTECGVLKQRNAFGNLIGISMYCGYSKCC